MRTHLFNPLACLILFSTTLVGQPVQIHPGHVKAKEKFKTKVLLLNGEKVTGKLVGCSDSSITLSLYGSYEDGHFYYDWDYSFSEIDHIILKRKSRGIGTAIVTPAGFFMGMAVVGVVDGLTRTTVTLVSLGQAESPKVSPGVYLAGGLIGAAVGAGIGTGIDQAARKKYVMKIQGDYLAFEYNRPQLKLMVIRNE